MWVSRSVCASSHTTCHSRRRTRPDTGGPSNGEPVPVRDGRSQLNGAPAPVPDDSDPALVTDHDNRLVPCAVDGDDSAEVQALGLQPWPRGKGSAARAVGPFPAGGGDSPGETWELYGGSAARVEACVERRGGPPTPSVVLATWTGDPQAGPLLLATGRRRTADGPPRRVVLSPVSGKLVGSARWVNARSDAGGSWRQARSIGTPQTLGPSRRGCRRFRVGADCELRPGGCRAAGAPPA